jgi:hypothetical protein
MNSPKQIPSGVSDRISIPATHLPGDLEEFASTSICFFVVGIMGSCNYSGIISFVLTLMINLCNLV